MPVSEFKSPDRSALRGDSADILKALEDAAIIAMRKPWKTIVGFALLGLAIAASSYAYAAFYDYAQPMNWFKFALIALSVILCPPQLLFGFCIDCEVIGWSGFIMYSIVGVLNAALYAAVGVVVVGLRKKPDSPSLVSE